MKSDLEKLMTERGVDGLVVMGPAAGNPNMYYVVDGASLTQGVYLRKRGAPPHLVYGPMERDAARATGIDGSTFPENDLPRFLEEAGGDGVPAQAAFLEHLLARHGMAGRIGVYGANDASRIYPLVRRLARIPGVEIFEDIDGRSIFEEARITKDAAEVERIRKVGLATFAAYDRVKAMIRAGRLVDGRLFDRGGQPITIGQLRAAIRATFVAHGTIEDHDSIVAQGVDGTAPHNIGTDGDGLREGESIIIDIFPRETGGGYFHDITRTFCVGAAPKRLREVFSQVREVLLAAMAELKVGEKCYGYQERTCRRFEAMGYATIRQDPNVISGYVHGLGHGLGLDIHEPPRLGGASTNTDVIQPGMVFTIEPGLYLPDEKVAVRLEDDVWVRPDGTFENLSPYPYDLEVFPEG